MTGSATGKDATEADPIQRHLQRLAGRLLLVALFTSQGLEGFVLHDFDGFDIINATVLNATVRMILSDESRFTVNITLSGEELGGEIRFDYMDSIKGVLIPPLVLKKNALFSLASSRMDLGSGGIPLRVTYTFPNGTMGANGTLMLTPYSEKADTPCASDWDCRKTKTRCLNAPVGRCRCPRGSAYDQHRAYCSMKCSTDDDCRNYLGESTSLCFLYKCSCKPGTYIIGDACAYPAGCISGSCTSGGVCENYKCLCPTGTISVNGLCRAVPCKNDSDCGLWLHMKCARTRPGSNDTFCKCADNSALLQGSCNPITDLGPCPYGRCNTEYSECDQSTSTCLCKKGYELRIYSTKWVCEKKDTEVVDRVCMDETQCYTGEICDENICKCPKGTELQNLQCAAIRRPKVRTNFAMFLWLSVVMMVLIVVFLSFGCCLYLLAQRAENEQEAIANMFDVSDDFDIKNS
ncbi:hypothetical protein MRX96_021903 [Rhipicephalus microplus]